jgi:mucosa-associated lymphoid tissue lymphoma translocation protein 1
MKGDLHFPENDVVAVADALRCLGFKVLVYVNVNFFEMCHVLQMFYELVQQGVYAVFYFAGHGFEFNRETYIMPVDADLGNIKTSFRETAIEYALQEHGARLGLLLLDCCRVWPGYSGSKCVLPSLGVGNMITQYSCCSLNPAYEVSKAGSNHSVYACQLRKVLEKLAAAGNMQQGTGHDSKIGSQMVGQRTEDSVDSGQASTVASMPAQAVGESFNLSVRDMLDAVAIAVNDERVSQRQGGRDTPWQVPQLRQHIIETDLSLADQVETEGSIARQNDRYYQALSSLIPTGKNIQKIAGSCPVCQVYLSYEMWTANVLLIGINVIPQDQNLTNKLKVEMQVKFDLSSSLRSVAVSGQELDVILSKTAITGCSHYMKIYNIQRLRRDEEMVVMVNISSEKHCKDDSLQIYIGSEWLCSSLQYSHGQKSPLSSLVSKLERIAPTGKPLSQRERSSSLPEVYIPVESKP